MDLQHFNLFPLKSVRADLTLEFRKLRGLPDEAANGRPLHYLERVDWPQGCRPA